MEAVHCVGGCVLLLKSNGGLLDFVGQRANWDQRECCEMFLVCHPLPQLRRDHEKIGQSFSQTEFTEHAWPAFAQAQWKGRGFRMDDKKV